MAAARERAARIVPADIELPSAETPQYVNELGYEVDAQTFALALQKAAEDLEIPHSGLQSGLQPQSNVAENLEVGETDLAIAEEEVAAGVGEPEGIAEDAEPLLSLSERYDQSPLGILLLTYQQCATLLSCSGPTASPTTSSAAHLLSSTYTCQCQTSSKTSTEGHFPISHTSATCPPITASGIPRADWEYEKGSRDWITSTRWGGRWRK
jgi:hypothetical protein